MDFLMKKYSKSLSVFSLIFFVIVFSSCMESSIRTRIIYLDGSGDVYEKTVREPYILECYDWDNFFYIPYIPEGSGYTTLNVDCSWKSPNGTGLCVELWNNEIQASETLYQNEQDPSWTPSGKCLAGAQYIDWTNGGNYSDCADTATRLRFYIHDNNNNYVATYGTVYIKKIWLSGSWKEDLVLFEATDYYYQPDYYQIDYTDYRNSNYSIKVRNESNTNVVCFKGAPSESTLISGVRAGATCCLKYNKYLFSNSGDFVLWVITAENYELYKRGKYDYYDLQRNPFALIYAYYNADSDSNSNLVYTISSSMGGEAYLLINNSTNYNVELRQNGLYGESLAFAGANTVQTKVYIAYDDYYIYPVFRKFQKKTGEIVTCFPKEKNIDKPVFFQFSLEENGQKSAEFNATDWFDPNAFKDTSTPAAAYITITNGNDKTGISLYKGANSFAEITSTGGKRINTGKSMVFEVPMVSYNKTFTTTAAISGWRIGSSVSYVNIPEIKVETGRLYYLDVGGDNAYDLTAQWRTNTDGVIISDYINFDED
jgi:hypothetical protein